MTTAATLGELMHKSYYGPSWHGPAVGEILTGVTAAQAARKPAIGSHSIWQLVLHMTAWKEEVLRRLSGPGRILSPDENWPPIPDPSDAAWQSALERLDASQQAIEKAVATLTDEDLATPALETTHGIEELLHAIIHHDLYHAGQIAILKTESLPE